MELQITSSDPTLLINLKTTLNDHASATDTPRVAARQAGLTNSVATGAQPCVRGNHQVVHAVRPPQALRGQRVLCVVASGSRCDVLLYTTAATAAHNGWW